MNPYRRQMPNVLLLCQGAATDGADKCHLEGFLKVLHGSNSKNRLQQLQVPRHQRNRQFQSPAPSATPKVCPGRSQRAITLLSTPPPKEGTVSSLTSTATAALLKRTTYRRTLAETHRRHLGAVRLHCDVGGQGQRNLPSKPEKECVYHACYDNGKTI